MAVTQGSINWWICIILGLCSIVISKTSTNTEQAADGSEDLFCYKDSTAEECRNGQNSQAAAFSSQLFRIDGAKVGYIQDVPMSDDGRGLKMKTINMKPLILEIEDFLTPYQSSYIISLAKQQGLQKSVTKSELERNQITVYDINYDKLLSIDEMSKTIEENFDVFLGESEILQLYHDLKMDKNGDELLSPEELSAVSKYALEDYLKSLLEDHPEYGSRWSEQAWIYPKTINDTIVNQLLERLIRLTRLPSQLFHRYNDAFQVVHYGVGGHYNAHYDSSDDLSQNCCHMVSRGSHCRQCRYMTIMFYLNTVEEGGETAFPIANDETYDKIKVHWSGIMNLYQHKCKDANLLVKPKKGKAVIWYNHFIDQETGWLGLLDDFSLHGGCPVAGDKDASKWIANVWINVSPDKNYDLSDQQNDGQK